MKSRSGERKRVRLRSLDNLLAARHKLNLTLVGDSQTPAKRWPAKRCLGNVSGKFFDGDTPIGVSHEPGSQHVETCSRIGVDPTEVDGPDHEDSEFCNLVAGGWLRS
jgi:hypothetical protein